MKRTLRCVVSVLAGSLGVTGAWGIAAVGCGGDDSQGLETGSPDGTTDTSSNEEAQSDVGVQADVIVQVDALAEAETGAGPDADAAPIGDGGAPDVAAYDGSAQTFPGQVAAAWCNTIATCCGTTPDAAAFNWQACYNRFVPFGIQGSNVGEQFLDGGHIAFDPTVAQECLNAVAAADCDSNQITSPEQTKLFQSCYAAYAGILATGAPCAASIECAPGNFCSPVDGGTGDSGAVGFCQPLAGDGGACGVLGANLTLGQTVCSYRGSGSNGLFCQNISGDAGLQQLNLAEWTCQPQWALGSDCAGNQDCASFICHQIGTTSTYQCQSAGNWANAATCATYVTPIVDAGGGG